MQESGDDHTLRRAKSLRRRMTFPERLLWSRLRHDALGVRFRRQLGVGPYVADFACPERSVIVEVDGMSHTGERALWDGPRQSWLEAEGWRVIRVTNDDVLERVDAVVDLIRAVISEGAALKSKE